MVDFPDFEEILGSHLGSALAQFSVVFRDLNLSQILDRFWDPAWRGRRQRRGSPKASPRPPRIGQQMKISASRPAPPSGGRRILRASPTAAGPFFGGTGGWLTGCWLGGCWLEKDYVWGSFWHHFGVILGSLGIILGPLASFWDHWAQLWAHSAPLCPM